MAIKNEILYQMYILLGLVVLAAVAIFGQLVKVSVIEGPELREMLDSSYVREVEIKGERGSIYAENGNILSASTPLFDLYLDFRATGLTKEVFEAGVDSLSYYFANYLDDQYTVGGWRARLDTAYAQGLRYFLLKKGVSYTKLSLLRKLPVLRRGQYGGGFIVRKNERRTHPFRMLARRTLGYVKGDVKVGLEGSFDSELSGEVGKEFMINTSKGWIPLQNLAQVMPDNGSNIYTTININLQDAVQNALLRGLQYHNADNGTAILMDVKTGAIKAISNIGKVNNGWAEVYNYGIGTASEPGSTFKLASMLALLEDGHVKLTDSVYLNKGRTKFYKDEMVDASAHGLVKASVRQAFEMSSNVGIATLVDRFYNQSNKGRARFIERLKDVYLHLPTGIEINGEASPYIKEPNNAVDQWSGTTIPWMSIGYEEKLTPLQMLNFYNTVANDGKMMKPYLVTDIKNSEDLLKHIKPTVISSRVISPKTVAQLKSLLEGVVLRGTARKLKSDHYRFAGKTGTAQMNYRSFKSKLKYQASFAGYFPAENPMYSCIVVVYNPREHGYYGGTVAGPIFREIADKCYVLNPNLKFPINSHVATMDAGQLPGWQVGYRDDLVEVAEKLDVPIVVKANEWAVFKTSKRSDSLFLLDRKITKNVIPNVVGMGLKDALYLLENKGVKVRFKGKGRVKKQSIRGGTAAKGQTIYLRLT